MPVLTDESVKTLAVVDSDPADDSRSMMKLVSMPVHLKPHSWTFALMLSPSVVGLVKSSKPLVVDPDFSLHQSRLLVLRCCRFSRTGVSMACAGYGS